MPSSKSVGVRELGLKMNGVREMNGSVAAGLEEVGTVGGWWGEDAAGATTTAGRASWAVGAVACAMGVGSGARFGGGGWRCSASCMTANDCVMVAAMDTSLGANDVGRLWRWSVHLM